MSILSILLGLESGCHNIIVEKLFKPSVKPEESTGQAELELMINDEPA
jgi:hypothetical protein